MTQVASSATSVEGADRPYLNIADAARLMCVSRDTVERIVARRELPVIRVSPKRRLIARADIETYISARKDAPTREAS